jgi:hypothetical protein
VEKCDNLGFLGQTEQGVSPREGVPSKDISFRVDEFITPGKARVIGKIDNLQPSLSNIPYYPNIVRIIDKNSFSEGVFL